MGSVDLIPAALTAMSGPRKALWERVIEECKNEIPDRGLSEEATARASASIDSLIEKSSAGSHSPAALSIFRYVGEGLTRSVLSMAYEDKLPFEWSCNWSAATMQEVMIRISTMIAPITSRRRSRILPHFPVSVVAAVMDVITHSDANLFSWWREVDNLKVTIKKATHMAKGFSGERVSDEEKDKIKVSIFLFADGLHHVEQMTGAKEFLSLQENVVDKLEALLKRAPFDNTNSSTLPRHLVTPEGASSVYSNLEKLDRTLGTEMGFWLQLQLPYLHFKEHSEISNICRNIVFKRGEKLQNQKFISIDNIVLDLAYLYSDIEKAIRRIDSEENQKHIAHIMTVLAVPWEQEKICNHRKLFMLSLALIEGIDTSKVDINLLINGVMEKLGSDGEFTTKRKKRTKLGARQTKRAPKLQPRVIYARPLSDSEDEYTSHQQNNHRSTLKPSSSQRVPNTTNTRVPFSPRHQSHPPREPSLSPCAQSPSAGDRSYAPSEPSPPPPEQSSTPCEPSPPTRKSTPPRREPTYVTGRQETANGRLMVECGLESPTTNSPTGQARKKVRLNKDASIANVNTSAPLIPRTQAPASPLLQDSSSVPQNVEENKACAPSRFVRRSRRTKQKKKQ